MRKKKTHDEYVEELSVKNPNIEVIEKYVNSQTSILHMCKLDGYIWSAKPNNVLQGTGCPMCAGNLKKTHEQYVREVCLLNPNIKVIEKYLGAQTKILHRCKIDGHEWMVAPTTILHGYGCPMCKSRLASQRYFKGHDEYVAELAEVNPNIEVLGEYQGCDINILHRCKIDGYEWLARPANVLHNKGCPKCAGNIKRTLDEYVTLLKDVNQDIEVVGDYINNMTPILHKCKIDGHEWMAAPGNILQGKGCPICKHSHGEKSISKWLRANNVIYVSQKTFDGCRDQNLLPFDFYIPLYNLCIEYDGEHHFRPVNFGGISDEEAEANFQKTQYHDTIKTQYCKDNNIRLFRIPYFKNVEEELDKFLFI